MPVYDIKVDCEPEFYANGILVHNCPECAPMDGQHFPMDDDNVPPLHPNCRCTAIPRLKEDQQADGIDYIANPDEPPRSTMDDWIQALGIILMINDFIKPAISADALDSSQV